MSSHLKASNNAFCRPPLDFSLTLLDMIDYNMLHNPDHPVFQHLNPDGSAHIVPWKRAGAAFYNAARIIQANCKTLQLTNSADTVVVGTFFIRDYKINVNTDSLTYIAVIIGIMLAGFVPFPISNRNSSAAVAHLLREVNCKVIIVSQDVVIQSQVSEAFNILNADERGSQSVLSLPIPAYEDFFQDTELNKVHPPLQKLRNVTQDSPYIIMHSSGSVSFPKPRKISHRFMLQNGILTSKGEVDVSNEIFGGYGIPMYRKSLPPTNILLEVTLGMRLSLPSPKEKYVPSPELVLTNAAQSNCTFIACVPSFIESWAKDKQKVEILKRFKGLLYGGSSLSITVGDMLAKEGVNLLSMYGSTETGAISSLIQKRPPAEGWEWLSTAPGVDLVFVPTQMTDENVYRLIVKTSQMKSLAVLNTTVEDTPAYDTNDLVIRHPTNPLLWKIFGRDDDQIMHSTGKNLIVTRISERRLLKDPKISSVIMFGRSKFQPGVLILPSPEYIFDPNDEVKLEEYRNLIWETVEQANRDAPQHSRIFKEFILVANLSKPFEFTAKGTPRRHAILKSYDSEIEKIYQGSESYNVLSKVSAPVSWEFVEIQAFLRTIVTSVLRHDIADHESIFMAGGDSLAAISIRNSLMQAIRRSKLISHSLTQAVPSDLVYMFPSVDALSAFTYGFLLNASVSSTHDNPSSVADVEDEIMLPLLQAFKGPTVVKLRKGNPGETPLIILHGAGGSISDFLEMSEKYHSALWVIQVTEETPLTSILALAEFYYGKIKEEQLIGPYRLAAYSGSSLLLMQMVQLFEANGDIVLQFDLLDHFPTVYLEGIDVSSLDSSSQASIIDNAGRQGVEAICKMVTESSTRADQEFRKTFAKEMLSALNGQPSVELAALFTNTIRSVVKISLEFLLEERFYYIDESGHGRHWSKEKLLHWMRKVKKTPTVYVAKDGLGPVFGIDDLGARVAYEDARVIAIEGNHFTFLTNLELLRRLQDY
ncbi:hypothetical protein BDQ17DRAFT_1248888 [Cyathus striatus]|nr:hypothetical protein BDQ17DRAFT_1248888 [Cyathus striatus]